MISENQDFVDQKTQRRYEAVREWIYTHRMLLARQGTVTASWRKYQGRRLGPFYRLAYRDGEQHCSIYLGKSAALADRVRTLLAECQAAMQEQRTWQRMREQARRELKKHKAQWRDELKRVGLGLKGSEVRGWRALRQTTQSDLLVPRTGTDCTITRR